MTPTNEQLLKEITFKTSRSGGKGGQNVNKVSSKVELIFNVQETLLFNEDEKALLLEGLKTKIDTEGNLHVVSQVDRSQLANKEISITKFLDLLKKSLTVQKKRKPTKIPKAVIAKRLANKSVTAVKKQNRAKPALD
ncbi:MAG: aminoacyl-tRNA hydrolase [Pedobacter sp.]|nr:MAG: aminoacyl-tRNA hydrolase [Pedobacter sp.]